MSKEGGRDRLSSSAKLCARIQWLFLQLDAVRPTIVTGEAIGSAPVNPGAAWVSVARLRGEDL